MTISPQNKFRCCATLGLLLLPGVFLTSVQGVSGFADSSHRGGVSEDRFFGVIAPEGVKSITIGGELTESDHIQYGGLVKRIAKYGVLDLSGNWSYSGAAGRATVRHTGSDVRMQLTYTPNPLPEPHYEIEGTLSNQALSGVWRYLLTGESPRVQTPGAFYATVSQTGIKAGHGRLNLSVLDALGKPRDTHINIYRDGKKIESAWTNHSPFDLTPGPYKVLFDYPEDIPSKYPPAKPGALIL